MLRWVYISVLLWALPFGATAQYTSTYPVVSVAGSFNGWNAGASNLVRVAPYVWQADLEITNKYFEFKFTTPSWANNWGVQDQPHKTLPIANYGYGGGGNILVTNTTAGSIIRFTFQDQTHKYSVFVVNNVGTNLLYNGSFETAGSTSIRAKYWEFFNPNIHGGVAGATERVNWATPQEGSYFAAILNTLANQGNTGTWWQEAPVEPGLTYEGSGYFIREGGSNQWTATTEELKLEFYDFDGQLLPGGGHRVLSDVGTNWAQRLVSAEAPPGSAYARWVTFVAGAGNAGNLRIDRAVLQATSSKRSEDFNTWGLATSDGNYTLGGWSIATAKTVSVIIDGGFTNIMARSGLAASLANPLAASNGAGYVQSPDLSEGGIGTISFYYRHGFTGDPNEGAQEPVRLRIETSQGGLSWTELAVIENIYSTGHVRYELFENDTTRRYVRISHAGGSTNRVIIDDINIQAATGSPRQMDFDNWPTTGTNAGCHVHLNWQVCTGLISSVQAKSGLSAQIFGAPGDPNHVRSPLFQNGYGAISFSYRAGTNGEDSVGLSIEASTNGVHWTVLDRVTNIVSRTWLDYSRYFYNTTPNYVRIRNLQETNGPSAGAILLEEPFNDGSDAPPGWTFSQIGEYTTASSSGESEPSISFNKDGSYVITRTFSNPTNATFMTKGQSVNPASVFTVQGWINNGWVTVVAFTNLTNSKVTRSVNLSTNITALRFEYAKVSGNLAFDDLLITGLPPASSGAVQTLMVDEVSVGNPEQYRNQNFNTWPSKNEYGTGASEHQYWVLGGDSIVDGQNAYEGQIARMRRSGSPAFIQSHQMVEGIGSIEFKYRRWPSDAQVTLQVQVSTNGLDWVTLTNITSMLDDEYTPLSWYLNSTDYQYFRLYSAAGSQARFLIDDIRLPAVAPPASISLTGWHDPDRPFTNDAVFVYGQVQTFYGARDLALTSYYRVGTSGPFTSVPMESEAGNVFRATNAIASQGVGVQVQYYIAAYFDGPGSEGASPVYYPTGGSNNPASYGIPRNPPGSVWINEIDHYTRQFSPNLAEFVELAGLAGVDISGWSLELRNGSSTNMVMVGNYLIPTNSLLPNDDNGFGFFVIGGVDLASPPRDMVLTNELALYAPGALRLLNEMGQVEQALAYRGGAPGHPYVGVTDTDFFFTAPTSSVSLVGTGDSSDDFTWGSVSPQTPGTANTGQTFSEPGVYGVSPASFTFEYVRDSGSPSPQMLVVSNAGGAVMSYTIATNAAWLRVSPTTGTGIAPGGTQSHTVSVNSTGQLGNVNGQLTLTGTAAPVHIPVALNEIALTTALLYYPFDEGAGASAFNHGTALAAGNLTREAGLAWSLNAAGASTTVGDYAVSLTNKEARAVTSGSVTALNQRANITITGWLYPTATGGVHYVVNNRSANQGFQLTTTPDYKNLAFLTSAGTAPASITSTNGQFPLNAWSFFAVTYDSAKGGTDAVQFYRGTDADSAFLYSTHAKGSLTDTGVSTGRVFVGASPSGPTPVYTNAFRGRLDDLRVFAQTLDLNELEAVRQESASRTSAALQAPVITNQPASQTVNVSQAVVIEVKASGVPAPNYQWRLNGQNLAGRVNSTVSISQAQLADAGDYDVIVFNVQGSVTSQIATLIVHTPPSYVQEPLSQTVVVGSNVTFSVVVEGVPTPALRWTWNGTNIAGAITSVYSITNVQLSHAGNYAVIATNVMDTVASQTAVLTVHAPPVFTLHPTNQSVTVGGSVTFSAAVTGTPAPKLQWMRNGTLIAGATSTNYFISTAQFTNAGNYSVRASNVVGVVTSQVAVLQVNGSLQIDVHPMHATAYEGETVQLVVEATGIPSPAYQWRYNTAPINGATASVYTIPSVPLGAAGNYAATVSNTIGVITSQTAVLTVVTLTFDEDAGAGIQKPTGVNGMVLRWSSLTNRTYQIYWTTNAMGPYGPLATNVPATPPVNAYTDTVHGVESRGFYQIRLAP